MIKTTNHEWIKQQIDTTRGELDRENNQEPGYSGPATDAYLVGYGKHPRFAEHTEQGRQSELPMRDWTN